MTTSSQNLVSLLLFSALIASPALIRSEEFPTLNEQEALWIAHMEHAREKAQKTKDSKRPLDFPANFMDPTLDLQMVESIDTSALLKSKIIQSYSDYHLFGVTSRFVYGECARAMCLRLIESKSPNWLRFEAYVRAVETDILNYGTSIQPFEDPGRIIIGNDVCRLRDRESDKQVLEWLEAFDEWRKTLAYRECFIRAYALSAKEATGLKELSLEASRRESLESKLKVLAAPIKGVWKPEKFSFSHDPVVELLRNGTKFQQRHLIRSVGGDAFVSESPKPYTITCVEFFKTFITNVDNPVELRNWSIMHLTAAHSGIDLIEQIAERDKSRGLRIDAWVNLLHYSFKTHSEALYLRLVKQAEDQSDPAMQAYQFLHLTSRAYSPQKSSAPTIADEQANNEKWLKFRDDLASAGLKSNNARVRYYASPLVQSWIWKPPKKK